MEEGGSSAPGDTGCAASTARPGSPFESLVVDTDRRGCEMMASTAVGVEDDIPVNHQTVRSELPSDPLQGGVWAVDPLEVAGSNSEDNVGNSPVSSHTHGVLESVCEEQRSASVLDPTDVAEPVNAGSAEDDDISDFLIFSPPRTVTEAELPNPSGTSHSNDDDSRSHKESASTASGHCGPGIDDSATVTDASQLEGQIQGMHDPEGDQIDENGRNSIRSEPAENLAGISDSVALCHPEYAVKDIAEDAHGSVSDTFQAESIEGQPEGPVQGADAIYSNQIDGSSGDPTGTKGASVHSIGDAVEEELVQPEKLNGVLLMHTGENTLQVTATSCTLPKEDDCPVQVADKEESHNDSSPKAGLCNSCHESPLLLQSIEDALQETSDACGLPEKVVHMAHEEESHNDSNAKVEICNSCEASPATEPSCSHVDESSSFHLRQGTDAPNSCHYKENAISGSIASSYCDGRDDEGTCGSNLHTLRDQCFHIEESSATHLQHPSDSCPTDSCLLLPDVATSAGTGSDDSAKSTPTSCSSFAECQPECRGLPENGGNNNTTKDPVSISRRRNPTRAAHFKPMSASVKPPVQMTAATESSRLAKTKKKKKTPVSGSLNSVSFGNATKKRTSRNVARPCGWGTIEGVYQMFENSNISDLPSELACTASTSTMLRKCIGRKRSNSKKAGKGSRVKCILAEYSLNPSNQRNAQVMFSGFAGSLDCESLEGTGHTKEHPEIEQASAYACSQVQFSPCYMNLDIHAATFAGDAHIGDKDLESSVTLETSNDNCPSDYPIISSQTDPRTHQTYVDTSPESEVIHPASDIDPTTNDTELYVSQKSCGVNGVKSQDDCFPDSHLQNNLNPATYSAPSALVHSPSLCSQPANPVEGKENGEIWGHPSESIQGPLLEKTDCCFGWERNARSEQDNQTGVDSSKCYMRKTKRKSQKEARGQVSQANCQSSKVVENSHCEETLDAEICRQYHISYVDHNEKNTAAIFTEAKKNKWRPKLKDFARSRQHDSFNKNKKNSNSLSKSKKNKEKSLCMLAPNGHQDVHSHTEYIHDSPSAASAPFLSEPTKSNRSVPMNKLHKSEDAENAVSHLDSGKISCESTGLINAELALQSFEPLEERQCWVRCDDCFKWRFIPTAIADTLGEDCKWTCKDNIDKNFADCVIPQAKTDAEINTELGISDEEQYNTAKPQFRISSTAKSAAKSQAPWTLIRSNFFLHRNRKKQNIDEVMVCQCKPPEDGSLGCGDACLNRMLNIECVRGTCPCGDRCSNQQFQRRKYAKMKWFRCGKKGYGLQVLQNVPGGKFLIEYVGEVLDMTVYEARQKEYASRGQRHFYFMTLNGSEVIDACYKGNIGRFINHSCNPNCRTEKWMVNGEVCIGLFAIRDIKKGEEVTFDYNYVRVFGAAAKKCFCGSSDCRGYIGGDPLNAENVVQCDSDEEFPEPVMLKDGEVRSVMEVKRQDAIMESTRFEGLEKGVDGRCLEFVPATSLQDGDESLQYAETVDKLLPMPPAEVPYGLLSDEKTKSTALATAALFEGIHAVTDTSLSLNQEIEVSLQVAETVSGSASETYKPVVGENTKQPIITAKNEEHAQSIISVKSCAPSVLTKNNRSGANKNSVRKGKKMGIGGHGCHFEGVEDKLAELLDANGGINKRRDSARGYLQLLFLTAASRDNAESEAIQSTRDMSMILDALLKTNSRKVLTDIIKKNGLQMLHNILKQSHRSNNKVPILRKLLKVFEYLALKGILTEEHFNMIPSREGVESFRDSIMSLTHHADTQVHLIARTLRNEWIRNSSRKLNRPERSNWRLALHDTSSCCSYLPSKRHYGQLEEDPEKILKTSHSMIHDGTAKPYMPPTIQETCKHDSLVSGRLNGRKRRRRRTRWDRDEPEFVESTDPESSETSRDHGTAAAPVCTRLGPCSDPETRNIMLGSRREKNQFSSRDSNLDNSDIQDVDEIPPGFDSPTWTHASESNREHGVAAASVNAGSCSVAENPNVMYGSRKDEWHSGSRVSNSDNSSMHDVDEIPPGFDCPSLMLHASKSPICGVDIPDAHNDVVAGIVQERYLPSLTISHGIPIQLMQQLGTPANGGSNGFSSLTVAPGMPYHPFPPLPLYPRKRPRSNHPPVLDITGVSQSHHDMMASGSTEGSRSARSASSSPLELSLPSTSGQMSCQSRNYSSFNSQTVKSRLPPMTDATRGSFRHQRCRDYRSNGFKTTWPRERNMHQLTHTKRCKLQNITDSDILEKDGGGSGFGDSEG